MTSRSDDNKPWWMIQMAKTMYDNVDKPKHYMLFPEHDIEVIDVIDKLLDKIDKSGYRHLLTSKEAGYYQQALQYLMRFMEKGGMEDIRKAIFYLNRIVKSKGSN